jgi:hypothetical protein
VPRLPCVANGSPAATPAVPARAPMRLGGAVRAGGRLPSSLGHTGSRTDPRDILPRSLSTPHRHRKRPAEVPPTRRRGTTRRCRPHKETPGTGKGPGGSPSPLMKISGASLRVCWNCASAHADLGPPEPLCVPQAALGKHRANQGSPVRARGVMWRLGKPVLPCIENSNNNERFQSGTAQLPPPARETQALGRALTWR